MPMNRKKYGIDESVVPHHPVKGEPTPEEMERRRPKGPKLTLDMFERESDAGNVSDLNELDMKIVNNKLTITRLSDEEIAQLKKLQKHKKLRVRNHGESLEIKS